MTPSTFRNDPANYRNVPMTRDRANDVCIAFGLAMLHCGGVCPIRKRPNGDGWDACVPMEFIENLGLVAPFLPSPPAPMPPLKDEDEDEAPAWSGSEDVSFFS